MVVEFYEKEQPKDFVIGLCKLALHQFYLTYRNPVIVKYLCERNSPIIGSDGWEPIVNPNTEEIVGQALVLVALGTKAQIDSLERERGFKKTVVKAKTPPPPLRPQTKKPVIDTKSKPEKDFINQNKKIDASTQSIIMESNPAETKNIETFLDQLMAQKSKNIHVENSTNTEPITSSSNPQPELRKTSDLLDSLHKALALDSPKDKHFFKAHIAVNSALHLPSRKKCKSKKSKGKNSKVEDILPSTYVTFEAYKDDLRITPIVPKSTNPKWDFRCEVILSTEYLTNNEKLLLFKVWRKSINTTMIPNMQTDVVIGVAAVDLTVLLAGLPSVQGWYNINDLSRKSNGQINIHVTPLENILKYKSQKETRNYTVLPENIPEVNIDDAFEEPTELLSRALKRKFTELDEITQRLRLRLSKVTNDESDTTNDDLADEFERDINTLCVEDDFDTVNFENEAERFVLKRSQEASLLRTDGNDIKETEQTSKEKIYSMLEKLSLFSAENSSRYVSGCSNHQVDTAAILNDLDLNSRPNIYTDDSFAKHMVLKFGSSFGGESSGELSRKGPEGVVSDSVDQSTE